MTTPEIEREKLIKVLQDTILKNVDAQCDVAKLSYEASWGNNRRRYDWIESLQVHLGESLADFILADRARIVEECAKIAESKAKEIIDMQTGLRSNPALEIAESLRRAGRKD